MIGPHESARRPTDTNDISEGTLRGWAAFGQDPLM